MTNLLIMIREPNNAAASTATFVASVCPYVGSFGGEAAIATVRHCREYHGGEDIARVTTVELKLSGPSRVDVPTLLARLERHLRRMAKDAELVAGFECFVLDDDEQAQAAGVS
jgi:hypothetical protein